MRHFGKARGEEAEINQFQRLPDDVLLHIFDKVSDIKSLCRCYVVSKRFSSLIPLVQTVSFKFKFKKKNPQGNNGLRGKFLKFLINKVLKPLRYFHKLALSPPLQSNYLPLLVFLSSLKQIRFLNVEFVFDFNAINDSIFKWGAKFTTKHASVSFLIAASLSTVMEPEEEAEEEEMGRRLLYSIMWVGTWLRTLSDIVPRLPMLQSITISDSINKGVKSCLGGEKLLDCRNAVTSADSSWKQNVRAGCVPVLELPMSGSVMKKAIIFNYKLYGDDDDYEANSAVLDAFAEEKGVFLEAVEQILEHHRDGIKPVKPRTRTHQNSKLMLSLDYVFT